MDGARLARLRWRLRGAWLWPSVVALTIADVLVGHLLPPVGEAQSATSALLVALFLNLIAVAIIAPALAILVRRRRQDLPRIVARDYAGTAAVVTVTVGLIAAGIAHHSTVSADHKALETAIGRAQTYIGTHAPDDFRRNVFDTSTYEIEPGSVFRTCVRSTDRSRTYCVVVKTNLPKNESVTFDGYESNTLFAQQAW